MTTTTDLELAAHLDVMARWAIRQAFEDWLEDGWETLSEVGQYDYERITTVAEQLLPADVTLEEFGKSLAFFENRAESV